MTEPGRWSWLVQEKWNPWRLGDTAALTFARDVSPTRMFEAFGFSAETAVPMTCAHAERELAEELIFDGPFCLRVAATRDWCIGIEMAIKAQLDGYAQEVSESTESVMLAVNGKGFGVIQHWIDRQLASSFTVNGGTLPVNGPDPAGLQQKLIRVGFADDEFLASTSYTRQVEIVLDLLSDQFGLELTESDYLDELPTAIRPGPTTS